MTINEPCQVHPSPKVQPSPKVIDSAQQYSTRSLYKKKAVLIEWVPQLFIVPQRVVDFEQFLTMIKSNKSTVLSQYMAMCETWIHQFSSKSKRLLFVRTFVISENRQWSEQYSLTTLSKDKVLLNDDQKSWTNFGHIPTQKNELFALIYDSECIMNPSLHSKIITINEQHTGNLE